MAFESRDIQSIDHSRTILSLMYRDKRTAAL